MNNRNIPYNQEAEQSLLSSMFISLIANLSVSTQVFNELIITLNINYSN